MRTPGLAASSLLLKSIFHYLPREFLAAGHHHHSSHSVSPIQYSLLAKMNAERSSHFVEQPVLHNPLVQRAIGWAARRRPEPFAGAAGRRKAAAAGTSESRLRPRRGAVFARRRAATGVLRQKADWGA
jgi:hypothetical protein